MTTRFHRKDFGHIGIGSPSTTRRLIRGRGASAVEVTLLPNTELMEFICLENEKDTRKK